MNRTFLLLWHDLHCIQKVCVDAVKFCPRPNYTPANKVYPLIECLPDCVHLETIAHVAASYPTIPHHHFVEMEWYAWRGDRNAVYLFAMDQTAV